ncbi:hypothetical protein [Sphingomonas echinoides]|uniref:Uncharacterized protein n=1 Tax=Sphingomonas echinoides TaxID=59803 RepID=A0ABU4PQJ2_9SPHN|nr:hypothetical protein [Sphingomonas echinoides]MDX5985407.1 hypothetical protein [Sphingomonas echinoides]
MVWLFISLCIFSLGSMLEYRTKNYPPLRPMGTADTVWKFLGAVSGVWFIILFVWMFFVVAWWVVIFLFIGAATTQGFFYGIASRLRAAPLISMIAMITGGIGSALVLYHLQYAAA